jgi:hypothetical protein
MEPTRLKPMLSQPAAAQSQHPDGQPRPLTGAEERRIARALRDDPPIYGPRIKAVTSLPQYRPTPRQPWDLKEAA